MLYSKRKFQLQAKASDNRLLLYPRRGLTLGLNHFRPPFARYQNLLVVPALQQQQSVQEADRLNRMRHVLGLCWLVVVGSGVPGVFVSVV